jgi:DNA sulfur modification protein DndB
MTDTNGILRVPALRAHMGDWIYYAAFLRMADIAVRVSLADEIHKHKALRDMIQRRIDESTHAESIKEYLLTQKQRLFNSLVIGVYGGNPNFLELSLGGSARLSKEELPAYIEGALGLLEFSGGEKMFAIDGQHRVVGIRKAVAADATLGDEEVITLFVGHSGSTKGMERSRRLFTTLNRYAKPVSKADIIALDEDDIVAILTRWLVEQHPFFEKYLLVKKGKGIHVTDKKFFTTIEALYDSIDIYLRKEPEWKQFKRARPPEAVVDERYKVLVDFWDLMIENFAPLSELSKSKPAEMVTAKYRSHEGGHLLFRPIGLIMTITVIRMLVDAGLPLHKVIKALSKVPFELTDQPWSGLLWDPVNQRMIMSGDNRLVAQKLLIYGVTGDIAMTGDTKSQLRREWAGILGKSSRSVTLPRWVTIK